MLHWLKKGQSNMTNFGGYAAIGEICHRKLHKCIQDGYY